MKCSEDQAHLTFHWN
ncbi:rCG24085 [Rattus norvegicus]|uniref:RCG24085 n=1 Tax=Rattus norvegicus TaxID=10116 RepID=A6JSS7_RAT|nr:rCG24085 [Rattus norvegicus]